MEQVRSQDDVLIDSMNEREAEGEKWARVCRQEGHKLDKWNVCDICGEEVESSDINNQAD